MHVVPSCSVSTITSGLAGLWDAALGVNILYRDRHCENFARFSVIRLSLYFESRAGRR